jgi:biopolymer transport protein ExbD
MYKKNKDSIKIVSYIGIILLLCMLVFYFTRNESHAIQIDLGTCKTPEQAFLETQKALNLLSTNINSGIENAQYIKEYETTKNKVFKK